KRLAATADASAGVRLQPTLVSTSGRRPDDPLRRAPSSGARLRFQDVAQSSGIIFRYDSGAADNLFIADTMGGGVALFDYARDGCLHDYFANGCALPFEPQCPPHPNTLDRTRGDGTFEDTTERARVAGQGYGMGASVGDFDNDGNDDLFVTGLDRTIL